MRPFLRASVLAAIGVLLSGCPSEPEPQPADPGLQVAAEAGGYMVREAGRPVLFYQLEPKSLDGRWERSNYIHPLYGLDGEILTEDFPEDHRHHRGIFWTWHQVLIGELRAGDPWLAQDFSWRVQDVELRPDGRGLFVRHHWHSPDFRGGEEAILEETAEVSVHPTDGSVRLIDFDIRLVPLHESVRLGGSEDVKGYGGFSVRVRMLEGLRFTAAGGLVEPAVESVDAGDWVDFSANFGASGSPSGVVVMVHPTSSGYPQPWILRGPETPSMQNPVWPGAAPMPVSATEPARLRYRLAVHRDDATGLDIAALADAYAATP